MSVVFDVSKQDLIGARVIDVGAREDDGDMIDFETLTLELVTGEKVRIVMDVDWEHDGEVFGGASLDVIHEYYGRWANDGTIV